MAKLTTAEFIGHFRLFKKSPESVKFTDSGLR